MEEETSVFSRNIVFFFISDEALVFSQEIAFCKLRTDFVLSRKGLLPVYVSIDVNVFLYTYKKT